MRIDYVTLFPEMLLQAVSHSMLKRASEKGLVTYSATDPRDFTTDNHRTVDDKPFGGGPGMLMMAEPIALALESLGVATVEQSSGGWIENPHQSVTPAIQQSSNVAIVLPDPTGVMFRQDHARELAGKERVVFLCGHYEGIDDRIRQRYVTHTFSLGDYVLTGGELPALVITDSIVRLIPGVLGSGESLNIDSHSDGLLSAPQFTRPEVWRDMPVPEVLRSGDHKAVERWKRRQALKLTRDNRADLFCRANLDKKDLDLLSS